MGLSAENYDLLSPRGIAQYHCTVGKRGNKCRRLNTFSKVAHYLLKSRWLPGSSPCPQTAPAAGFNMWGLAVPRVFTGAGEACYR